jgi:hypothetical protein
MQAIARAPSSGGSASTYPKIRNPTDPAYVDFRQSGVGAETKHLKGHPRTLATARRSRLSSGIGFVRDRASAATPKSVGVHGAQAIQECLDAGLLDEIHIDLAAVLPGAGVRLFDHLANTPVVLGDPTVVTGVGVTHLRYPVHTS